MKMNVQYTSANFLQDQIRQLDSENKLIKPRGNSKGKLWNKDSTHIFAFQECRKITNHDGIVFRYRWRQGRSQDLSIEGQ
jgi:hypothetical protein